MMPIEYALITQFLSFVGLYYVDTRATMRGWTPPWCKYDPCPQTLRPQLTAFARSQTVSTDSC
jgi:hypothetical protein